MVSLYTTNCNGIAMIQALRHREYRNIVSKGSKRKQGGTAQKRTGNGRPSVGEVRIIAGRWRGRKLPVVEVEGLRPTGDRVRETLFNWLQADVAGAQCLDLFAGSGALGFEALSRYAASVTFVEPNKHACQSLQQSMALLEVDILNEVEIGAFQQNANDQSLQNTSQGAFLVSGFAQTVLQQWQSTNVRVKFDLVFIDPPFEQQSQWTCLDELSERFLANDAKIYLESPSSQPLPEILPKYCSIIREKRFGDVTARLVQYKKSL